MGRLSKWAQYNNKGPQKSNTRESDQEVDIGERKGDMVRGRGAGEWGGFEATTLLEDGKRSQEPRNAGGPLE